MAELLRRAKRLFHKTQIQILLEAISEYTNHRYEYGTAVLSAHAADKVVAAWSAGVFECFGVLYPRPSSAMKIAVTVTGSDRQLLSQLKDTWGGSLYREGANRRRNQKKELWVWGLRSEKGKRFLEATLPYMKGTKSQEVREYLGRSESTMPIVTSRGPPYHDVNPGIPTTQNKPPAPSDN